jgi:hypothetical protein
VTSDLVAKVLAPVVAALVMVAVISRIFRAVIGKDFWEATFVPYRKLISE